MKRILFIIFLHGSTCCVYSQQKYTITTYSQEQGLPSGNIRGIYKDTIGYVWLTTEEGVARFNGYSFKTFRHNPDDSTSLTNNATFYGSFPELGDIYFYSSLKNCSFNPTTELFSPIPSFGDIFKIDEAKGTKDCYWVMGKSAIFRITKAGTERFEIPNALDASLWTIRAGPDNCVMLFRSFKSRIDLWYFDWNTKMFSKPKVLDRNGMEDSSALMDVIYIDKNFYLFTERSAYRFDPTTRSFAWHFDFKRTQNFQYDHTYYFPYNDSLFVITSKTGFLNILNIRTGAEKLVYINKKIPEGEVNDRQILEITVDRNGGIWLSTTQLGVVYYNLFTGELEQYFHEAGNSNSLPGNFVQYVLPDENGVIWVSCAGHGLTKMEPVIALFKTAVPTTAKNSSNSVQGWNANIRGFFESEDGFWIGTMKGLFNYSTKTHRFSEFLYPPSPAGNTDFLDAIPSHPVGSFAKDQAGNLWFGTWYGDLIIYDTKLNRSYAFERPQPLKDHDKTGVFRHLFCDKNNRMWISTYGAGVCRVDCNTLDLENLNATKFEYNFYDSKDSSSISSNYVFLVAEDAEGNIWAGTDTALCRWNEQTKKWKRYYNIPGDQNSIHHNNVRSMCLDKQGNLWIGTNGGGLNRYNKDKDNFIHFTRENGLPDDQIYSLLCDDNGLLWMGTNRGLCRFNPVDFSYKNFTEKDGIQNYEYNTGAAIKLKDGTLLIGGVAGYNIIDPNKIGNTESQQTRIVISSFKVFEKETATGNGNLELKYNQNSFTFEYASLSFYRNQETQYAYQLVGVDRDWVYSGTRRNVSYSKLEPGNYVFKVKASGLNGVWSETGAELHITLAPPWWRTTWAYTLYAILFLGMLVGYALFIRKREKEKTDQVRKEAELKLQSLRAQLNPHFMFNSLTAIHDLILTEQTEQSRKYLIRFSKLLRMILENAEQPFVSLDSELQLIDNYLSLEKLRLADLEYSITTDPSINKTETVLPNMILQPYIENALWHGLSHKQGDRKLELNVYKKNGAVIYDVKDNGVGRKRSSELKSLFRKEHKSKGMELLNDRFKLLREEFGSEIKTEISDITDNGEVKGTEVVITIPDSLLRKKM